MRRGPIILIVDDEQAILELLSDLLEEEGYTVLVAVNGRQALERLAQHGPHLVLCDVMMPQLDGRQMSQRLQTTPGSRAIPLIFMSAISEDSLGLNDCNYAAFLRKPFELDQLLELVTRLLGAEPRDD